MAQLHFFVGKGGVGKTTVSSAFAVQQAIRQPRGRVLLMSTDPAHSLADILQTKLYDRPKSMPLRNRGHLDAWQIPGEKLFRDFLREYKSGILDLIDKGSLFSRADIEPLLDASLPGMAEIAALLAIREALSSSKYASVVVDTAPFGHTLRLFSLPDQFERFLRFLELAATRDQVLAEHFRGKLSPPAHNVLARLEGILHDIKVAVEQRAEITLVTTAERFSLNEALRSTKTLQEQASLAPISRIVLNRVRIGKGCSSCKTARNVVPIAEKFLRTNFAAIPVLLAEDPGGPIMGMKALEKFGNHVFHGKRLNYDLPLPVGRPIALKKANWPVLDHRISFVLGKGGVGKTTTSAALAFHTRRQTKIAVEICSVDPAPSLKDLFQTEIGPESRPVFRDDKFHASELDAAALFRDWVDSLRQSIEDSTTSDVSGIHLDLSFERKLLSELLEVVPPGVDEVLAIFRIFDFLQARDARVVIDMAPTGHALELLRMPERLLAWCRVLLKTLAAHRTLAFAQDAAVKVAEVSMRTRELAALLQDAQSSEIDVVMLPELLPDRETERLLEEIRQLGLPLRRVFVNRVLMKTSGSECSRCRRAQKWQQATLAAMKRRYKGIEIQVMRNFPREIAGKKALQSFTGEAWRLA